MATIKIIHSADWQLGKPFGRFPAEVRAALAEARLDAIDRIAEAARVAGAGHVLVAGDVFDNVEPGDRIMLQAMARMERSPARWWLMPGNHDYARAGGLWSRVRARATGNVQVVDTATPLELEEGAWLLPAPLEHRKTSTDPTAAMVEMVTPAGALRIGLAHGSITEFGASGDGANLIPPDRARLAGLDYLALGDWHGFLTIGDRTAYSGTPEVDRFGREEAGACIAVTIRSAEPPAVERIATGRYRWLSRRWEVGGAQDLTREIDALRQEGRLADMLLDLRLSGIASLSDRVAMTALLDDMLAHELRYLDVDAQALIAHPTPEDVAAIDVRGALGAAAATLREQAEGQGPGAALAGAALERLYVETLRYDRGDAQ